MWEFIIQEAVAIGRTFASMKDYQLDGNKEMVALGTMNIVGSMTSCYVATGKEELQFSDLDRIYSSSIFFTMSFLFMSYRFFLSISSKLYGRMPNCNI